MKRTTKTIVLIVLAAILALTLVACAPQTGLPTQLPDDEGPTTPIFNINKNQLMRKISDGMLVGAERIEDSTETYVSSVYTIHTGYINYTIDYKANYASRRQNSQIYVKVFDNNYHMNRIFIYYNKGDLFLQSQDEKHSIPDFGSTNMFDLFFEMVTMFDMSGTFIGQTMSDLFNPDNIGANLSPLVDQSRMKYIKVTDTAESIEIKDVNLNYGQIKIQVNNMIKNTFEKFERKFDLLSLKYLGLRISDLAILEIATMTGDFINVRLDRQGVETVVFEASGDMADGINTFNLEMEVVAREGKGEIEIDSTENPYTNTYPEMFMGRYNYGGTLYVPFFDMTYDATLRTILSSTDNTVNQVIFTIDSVNEEMGGLFYKDQMMYVDISGMNRQLNGAIELEKLNLPKVKFEGINLAQEITLLINDVLKIVQSFRQDDDYGENEELMQLVLDNIYSDEKTKTISINITKALIEQLYGEDVDLVDLLAQKLKVDRALIAQILGDNALENAVLVLSYNVENGDIGVDLYDGDFLIFQLRLSVIDPLPGDTLVYPESFNPDYFYWLEIPDNTILSIDGSLSMQQVSKVQFDQLFGALFGDITGLNTPYTLYSNEVLDFSLDIMQVYSYVENSVGENERTIEQVMKFEIFKRGVLQLGVYSSSDPNYLLINFNVPIGPSGSDKEGLPYKQSALKYRIERQKVKDAFNELLGEDNIFVMENIMDVLSKLLSSVRDSKSMQLRFVNSSLAFNLISDTVKEIIGIDNLNALLQARVRFAVTAEEYLDIRNIESQYPSPNVRPLENRTFESIYKTQWHEFVYAYFGENLMRLKLTFLPNSVKIVSGKYFYQPRAKLLDVISTYYVTIQDGVNGIKIVQSVIDPDTPRNKDAVLSETHPLSIDPSQTSSLPGRISVLYDDGTFGDVEYIIEGFDVSNITISGMPRAEFWLIIGKGSVAEKSFYVSVQVLGRVIVPLQEIIKGEVVYMKSDEGVPVVAEVTVDPYSYAIRKAENPLWSPLPSSLILSFESPDGIEDGDIVPITNIDWDFAFTNIQYNGGVFYTHAMFNNLPIALKLNVKSKIVSYLRFVDAINTSLPIDQRPYSEAIGQYTVDVLQTSTYTFPTSSTETQELRLYFEDGTYRIIGNRDHTLEDPNYYNNYLPLILQWKHKQVNESSVRLVGTKAPLGVEDKNINTTTIGNEGFTIGAQAISLNVLMPTRAEASIGNAGSIFAITGYGRLGDDSYNFEAPVREMTSYSNAAFAANKALGEFFDFNPYNQMPLPNKVYLDVIQGGETRVQRKAYDIEWNESDVLMARHTYNGVGQIVYTDYILRHVSTDEEHLLVTGTLGDGRHTIQVRMIVRNLDALYQDITFEGMETNETRKTIDPYLAYNFPSYYTLMLKNGTEITVEDVEWFIVLQPGQNWMLQLYGRSYHWIYDYLQYLEDLSQGYPVGSLEDIIPDGFSVPTVEELDYFRLLIEKGEIPVDNKYVFSHLGGNYTIKSYVEATDTVIAQEVSLSLTVISRNVLLVDTGNGYTRLDIYNTSDSQPSGLYMLDTYQAESTTMLTRLEYLRRYNDEYDLTIRRINNLLADRRRDNPELSNVALNALVYDEYKYISSANEQVLLVSHYNNVYGQYPNSPEEELKFFALQSYMSEKTVTINKARTGIYFGDNPETSMNKYLLNVRWTNLDEIITILQNSTGAALGVVLEGYLGYGQINQQPVKVPFKITRRDVTTFSFNRLNTGDSELLTVDYRYVYIADEAEAVSMINTITDNVMSDNDIPQHNKSKTIFDRLYGISSDIDRLIMEEAEQKIYDPDEETRYALIMEEIIRLRMENIRKVFINLNKPMGLTQDDGAGNMVFLAPSEYFYEVLSQVSLEFNSDRSTAGYFAPRFVLGNGETLVLQKKDFDEKLLLPVIRETDPLTGFEYAVVDILLTHLSAGSCAYPVTVRFRAIVDSKDVEDGRPTESEIDPFDENGNIRFTQGYKLPERITINYRHSQAVTFKIPVGEEYQNSWRINGVAVENGIIPKEQINVLNPSILDYTTILPCDQGEFTYHISFPQKYIGKTRYNAKADDRSFQALDIESGIIEIDNIYEIYDPSKPNGFDISKLPHTINPYTYELGEVTFDTGDEIIETFFSITGNNSYYVEWTLATEWINRKIDHNGTTVIKNGELSVEPVLFATARVDSYFYTSGNVTKQLNQEIELYIKVKPLSNPIIEFEGLVDYSDNNYISFDPYDDPNNYGGNLVLPKNGLTVYFNNNLTDAHTFDARAVLSYELLMADSSNIVRAYLYDALMRRSNTLDAEKRVYLKAHLNSIISTYAVGMGISIAQATENIYSAAFDAVLESGSMLQAERQKQRTFLVDFASNLLSTHYGFSDAAAWRRLMQNNNSESARSDIILDYMSSLSAFNENDIVRDLSALYAAYDSFVSGASQAEKQGIVAMYLTAFNNDQKAAITSILESLELYGSERMLALETINQQGGIPNQTQRNAQIFNLVMEMVSVNSRLDILRIALEESSFCELVALSTAETEQNVSKALLFIELAAAVQNRSDYLGVMSLGIVRTMSGWIGAEATEAYMWNRHIAATIERADYMNLKTLVETYMSSASTMSLNRIKEIVFSRLINVYDYNDTDMQNYFGVLGDEVAARMLQTAVDSAQTQLQDWQVQRAKSAVWQSITAALTNEGLLARVLNGETDNTGRIDTVAVRALAYERLRLSSHLPIFEERLNDLEEEIVDSNQEYRRATIYRTLYEQSSLSEKVILAELMAESYYSVSDTQKPIGAVQYTQAGHSILEIESRILYFILYLPDGQSISITLNIFSREIKEVLVPNTITNHADDEVITTQVNIPNVYYIDPYNSETFKLPSQAEFVFETGYNLVLDINEWLDYDENVFYTRGQGFDGNKIFYYNLTENSYRGGHYTLRSYLTYGIGASAERQLFEIQIIVLNRTLKQQYSESFDFENPMAGRRLDIPSSLTNDMFVEIDVYYKSFIAPEHFYSNFGTPIVPQIDWSKTSYNEFGLNDSDILVSGGFDIDVQGYLYYDNNLLTKTYQQIWQALYNQFAATTKPLAWEKFFEIMINGERVVKTVFAGEAAVQIKALDDLIYDELYIEAYKKTLNNANADLQSKIENLMETLRNNNIGLIADESSELWYIVFYQDLETKAKNATLSAMEAEVWGELYSTYVSEEISTISLLRAEKWDELFAMTGIWQGQQKQTALGYLDQAYKVYRDFMLVSTWETLESVARTNEAAVMAEIIERLRQLYGSVEQAKIRGWDFLRSDDRTKGIIGETAQVNITAKSWDYKEIRNMVDEIISEITFNAFTKTSNEDTFKVTFDILNTLLIERLNETLDATILEYYDDYRDVALDLFRQMLMDSALEELDAVDQANSGLSGNARKEKNWEDLYAIRVHEATSPIDDTRADVEASGTTEQYARDTIVWQRLLEGAGEWVDEMTQIYADTQSLGVEEYQRYYYAVNSYRDLRITVFTEEMNTLFDEAYFDESLNAWNTVAASPQSYGETSVDIEYILLKDVLREAWIALEGYSTTQQVTSMRSHLDPTAYGVLQYSRGWISYYNSLSAPDAARKSLMDDLQLYYYGFDRETQAYAGYAGVYNYITQYPESIGETLEGLNSLKAAIEAEMVGATMQSIVAESIRRLLNYVPSVADIYQIYMNDLKRDAWAYLIERKSYPANMTALLPDSVLAPAAWNLLYEKRAKIAEDEYAIIDSHFNDIALEQLDQQKKRAYNYLVLLNEGTDEEERLNNILNGLDNDAIKTILWQELYVASEGSDRLSMDSTLNQVIREGREPGIDAEAISWDRLLSKNETSLERMTLMMQMYEAYTKARAFEQYVASKNEESTLTEDSLLEYYIQSYKKSKVWDELYNEADAVRQDLMDDIFMAIAHANQDIRRALSLDTLVGLVPEEADIIYLRVQSAQLEYGNNEVKQEIKASEWDAYYSAGNTQRRQAMDTILNNYASILQLVDRKAAALDDSSFRNLLGPLESQALNNRLNAQFDALLETFFYVMTYDELYASTYTAELDECYSYVYQRFLVMHYDGDTNKIDTDTIKKYALLRLRELHFQESADFFNLILEAQLPQYYIVEYKALTWTRYYAYNLENDQDKVEMMDGILHGAVTSIMNTLKAEALDRLYQTIFEDAASRITEAEANLIDTIKKNALWISLFGEDLQALRDMLGDILPIDDNDFTLKNDALQSLMTLLATREGYYSQLLNQKLQTLEQYPELTPDQRDASSWDSLYQSGVYGLAQLMDEVLAPYGLFGESNKHLALRDLEDLLDTDKDHLDTIEVVRTLIYGENTQLSEQELNARTFDRAYENYAAIAIRLDETVFDIKQNAWQAFTAQNSGNTLLSSLFEEMYALELFYQNNDEGHAAAICWDRFVNMTINIDETLASVDQRYSEDELRAFSINCILNLLGGDERAVLQNALDAIIINHTLDQLGAMVYDIVYSASIPVEKASMKQHYDTAAQSGGTIEAIKTRALNAYKTQKSQNAASIIDDSYETLNNSQKTALFEELQTPKTGDPVEVYTLEFAERHWNGGDTDTIYGRTSIFWDLEVLEDGGDIAKIFIGNAYKAFDNAENVFDYQTNVFEVDNFLYKNRQIIIEKLDFYGELNIYSGEEVIDVTNYYNQLVIDPLSPYIPTKVAAYGSITGVTPNIEIGGELYSYIGEVDVSFESRINEFLYDAEGVAGESMTATVSPGLGEGAQNITITVYYLNRQPTMYYVNNPDYTSEALDEDLNLYPLSMNIGDNKVLTVDPLNDNIYNTSTGNYIMPNSLVVMFTDAYADGIISTLFMNDVFNKRLDISGINWNLMGNSITLAGLAPSNISINSYTVDNQEIVSTAQMDSNFWKIQLDVLEKDVDRTLEVNQQGQGGIILAARNGGILTATKKIDPYNVMVSFPDHVRVEFTDGSESKLLTNISWQFAEGRGLEYLQLPEVITGTIGESAMFITAGFECVSEIIWINFPIQKRHIDISVEGSEEIRYLEGGTIYLVKDVDLMTQLNKYSSLYYNFAEYGESADWSEVPLEFLPNDVSQISTAQIGKYTVRGRLGQINDPNIVFEIVVIDPKLYAIDAGGQLNPKVYYDSLTAGVNTFGVRQAGKENEDNFLPGNLVQLGVTDSGGNVIIGYNEFEITQSYWDIANKKVIFTCVYTFLDENDDVERLAGGLGGSQQLYFTVSLPLKTYLYSAIDDTMVLRAGSDDGTNILKLPLGQPLKMSDLPNAIMNYGRESAFEVPLLWDLRTINVNKAGTYSLSGYYRDYTSSYPKSKNLEVVIDKVDISNSISTLYALTQTYTGLYIEVTPVLPDVLREQGNFAQLRLGRDVIVEYLTEEKYNLQAYAEFSTTPYKDAGAYYVRIRIEDYNTVGQKIFRLLINPIEIDPQDIVFEYGEGASNISVKIPEWPETEAEKNRLFFNQFRIYANQHLGSNVSSRARAEAYDTLYSQVSLTAQELLTNRYNAILANNFPQYESSDETAKANMMLMAKAMVWEEVVPYGVSGAQLVPGWPKNDTEKQSLFETARQQLENGGSNNEAMAQAYDNLFAFVINLGKVTLQNRLDEIIQTRFPNYNEASEAMKTVMLIEAKSIVWSEIVPTGLVGHALITNWPKTMEEKELMLDEEYEYILNLSLAGSERELFIKQVKALAYDELLNTVYTTAQTKLQTSLASILQIYYPLYDTYGDEQKALILTEAKSIVWDQIVPGDTVTEKSYVYDGQDHMPVVTGMPQAKIVGWPQTPDEKAALLSFAHTENSNFTEDEARARAFDNLMQRIYSNIFALQKMTNILNSVIAEFYPDYNLPSTPYEVRQQLLIQAKAKAWDTRIVYADTVEEIYYSFSYWYADMNNNGMTTNTRPRSAGTYEITLLIDPLLNRNYRLKADAAILTTISIRRATINQSFLNEMVYRGTAIMPECSGLHDENGNLPQGVSIQYTYLKDGQPVSFIRDVGEYIFSAVINGGNNYPSWVVDSQIITISKKDLTIDLGTVESGYLENTKALNSSITFDGIVGGDLPSMFGYLVCESPVTNKHMVGDYAIDFTGFKTSYDAEKIYYLDAAIPVDDVMAMNASLFGNYSITVINGTYRIKKANENAVIINDQTELEAHYDALPEGNSVIWYLAPGNYGDLVINKNVGITIIGCYDVNAVFETFDSVEDNHERTMSIIKSDAGHIVTVFESIVINRGALTVDIVKIGGKRNKQSIYIGANASAIEVRRSSLVHTEVFGDGGVSIPQNAGAIYSSPAFKDLLRIDRTYVEGFTTAVYLNGAGALEVVNSRFNRNTITAIRCFNNTTHIEGSRFEFTGENALYLEMLDYTVVNSSFMSNRVAIRSLTSNTYDLWLENTFANNVKDIITL